MTPRFRNRTAKGCRREIPSGISLPAASRHRRGLSRFSAFLPLILLLGTVLLSGGCLGSDDKPDTLQQASDAFTTGQYLKAEKLYELYLQTNPEGERRWEAWNRLLDLSLNVRGDRKQAAAVIEATILEYARDTGRMWDLHIRLAEIYADMQDWDNASSTLQRLINIPNLESDNYGEGYRRLAAVYLRQGEYDLARDALESCAREAQSTELQARCRYEMSQVLGFMEIWESAEQLLQELVDNPGISRELHALAAFSLADIYEQKEHYAAARQLLESIVDTYPNPRAVEVRLESLQTQE